MKAATALLRIADYDTVISIHAAREGGDLINDCCARTIRISIHAAREGGDSEGERQASTFGISIHAAREGGDAQTLTMTTPFAYFNPRRP